MPETKDKQVLIRYLLEDLGEKERDLTEQRYFTDNDFYTRLMVAEDELIDAYVHGELSRRTRAKFERAYLTNPHRLRKVESSRELLELFGGPPPTPAPRPKLISALLQTLTGGSPRLVYTLASLLLFAVLCGVLSWSLLESRRLRVELEEARERLHRQESRDQPEMATREVASPGAEVRGTPAAGSSENNSSPVAPSVARDGRGTQEKKTLPSPAPSERSPASILAFSLPRPGPSTRSPNGRTADSLVIRRGVVLVRLSVKVAANKYDDYEVSLRKPGELEGWTQTVRKNQPETTGARVRIEVPASFFKSGDYILKVTGKDQILAFHQLTVVKHAPPLE